MNLWVIRRQHAGSMTMGKSNLDRTGFGDLNNLNTSSGLCVTARLRKGDTLLALDRNATACPIGTNKNYQSCKP